MQHEKIITREDGSSVRISVTLGTTMIGRFEWRIDVAHKPPRKRLWQRVIDSDRYTWRRLTGEERRQYKELKFMEFVTVEEIQQATRELIASIPIWQPSV